MEIARYVQFTTFAAMMTTNKGGTQKVSKEANLTWSGGNENHA